MSTRKDLVANAYSTYEIRRIYRTYRTRRSISSTNSRTCEVTSIHHRVTNATTPHHTTRRWCGAAPVLQSDKQRGWARRRRDTKAASEYDPGPDHGSIDSVLWYEYRTAKARGLTSTVRCTFGISAKNPLTERVLVFRQSISSLSVSKRGV